MSENKAKPHARQKGQKMKFFFFGVFVACTIPFIFLAFLLFTFSPLVSIDDKNERVVLLGGLRSC